jgi:hypothetical protein
LLPALCVVCTALGSRAAHAQSADALAKAQVSFDTAQQDYLRGDFEKAATEFQAAYDTRQFAQFLYDAGGAYYMKAKKDSDENAYDKAVEYYKKYIAADPTAADKDKVEKAIGVLEAEGKRIRDAKIAQGSGATPTAGSGAGSAAPVVAPSKEVADLGDAKVRGLMVIESEPQNATIYLDDRAKGPFATTPWSGTLEGEHKIIIEKRGYQPYEKTMSADPSRLVIFATALSQSTYLGWVEVSSNIPNSEIFLDDKNQGAIGKTPMQQNIKPGKHTFYITTPGYDEYKQDVEVIAGESIQIKANLKGNPVGKLNITGPTTADETIFVDGKVLCERGPCLRDVREGDHDVLVTRPGAKPYARKVNIQAKTETSIRTNLQKQPGRGDAVAAYVLSGVFLGTGIYLGVKSSGLHDDLKSAIAAGNPPVDDNDPRFLHGKIYAWTADAGFALSGVFLLTGIYYTFREKGAPSTGLIDVRALALSPAVGPDYAGVAMGGHF